MLIDWCNINKLHKHGVQSLGKTHLYSVSMKRYPQKVIVLNDIRADRVLYRIGKAYCAQKIILLEMCSSFSVKGEQY